MKIKDKGILPQSQMFFTMANEFTKKALYYLTYSGSFHCTNRYKVNRENFNSYLFLYVKKGKMKIKYKNRHFVAPKDTFVFLDCHHPHVYQAEDVTIFDWFHFSGNSSKEYFELLYEKNGCVYALNNHYIIPQYMTHVLKMAQNNEVDEHKVSIYIQKILYELIQISTPSYSSTEKKIEESIIFIENHYKENIKLEDISNSVYLSPYYFTRSFKKYTNYSPVEYLINYRINNAKEMLQNTNLTINEVADTCGFNNTSHFITTFKNHVGLSPKKFRKIQF